MTKKKIEKELHRIAEKDIYGEELTPEEAEFLHTEMKKCMVSRKDTIEDLKELQKYENEHGIGSVTFSTSGEINPETGMVIGTLSEYIHVLEKEEEAVHGQN